MGPFRGVVSPRTCGAPRPFPWRVPGFDRPEADDHRRQQLARLGVSRFKSGRRVSAPPHDRARRTAARRAFDTIARATLRARLRRPSARLVTRARLRALEHATNVCATNAELSGREDRRPSSDARAVSPYAGGHGGGQIERTIEQLQSPWPNSRVRHGHELVLAQEADVGARTRLPEDRRACTGPVRDPAPPYGDLEDASARCWPRCELS